MRGGLCKQQALFLPTASAGGQSRERHQPQSRRGRLGYKQSPVTRGVRIESKAIVNIYTFSIWILIPIPLPFEVQLTIFQTYGDREQAGIHVYPLI